MERERIENQLLKAMVQDLTIIEEIKQQNITKEDFREYAQPLFSLCEKYEGKLKNITLDIGKEELNDTLLLEDLLEDKETVNFTYYLLQLQEQKKDEQTKEIEKNYHDLLQTKSIEEATRYYLEEKEKLVDPIDDLGIIDLEDVADDYVFGEETKPIPTVSKVLNEWTGGFWRSEPNCLVAGSGEGKTLTALNCALHNILDHDLKVLFISQEMKRKALMQRVTTALSNREMEHWKEYNHQNEDDFLMMKEEARTLIKEHLKKKFLVTDKRLKLSDLLKTIKKAEKVGVDVIFCDYFQLIYNDISHPSIQGYERDGETSKIIKDAILPTRLSWVWLSQITKDEQTKKDPRKASIRGSKQLENDCATMILLYRKEDDEKTLNAWVMKARHGEKFKETQLNFDGKKQRVGDLIIPKKEVKIKKPTNNIFKDSENTNFDDFDVFGNTNPENFTKRLNESIKKGL